MTYKSNPIINRTGITHGWADWKFSQTSLYYTPNIIKWFKFYCFIKEYFRSQQLDLIYCEIKPSFFSSFVIYIGIHKNLSHRIKKIKKKIHFASIVLEHYLDQCEEDIDVDEPEGEKAFLEGRSAWYKESFFHKHTLNKKNNRFQNYILRRKRWARKRRFSQTIKCLKKHLFYKKYKHATHKLFKVNNGAESVLSILFDKLHRALPRQLTNAVQYTKWCNLYKLVNFLKKTKKNNNKGINFRYNVIERDLCTLEVKIDDVAEDNYDFFDRNKKTFKIARNLIERDVKLNMALRKFIRLTLNINSIVKLRHPIKTMVGLSKNKEQNIRNNYRWIKRYFKSKIYLRTRNIILLSTFYKNPQLLADHISYELARIKKRHKPFLNLIRDVLFWTLQKGIKAYWIGIYGKVNAGTRTQKYFVSKGGVPIQSFNKPVYYGFAHSPSQTGVFGVKVWFYY